MTRFWKFKTFKESFNRERTGSSDGSEDPALAVLDWFASVAQKLLKDSAASGPDPRTDSVLKGSFELSFQQTVVVVGVDLSFSNDTFNVSARHRKESEKAKIN